MSTLPDRSDSPRAQPPIGQGSARPRRSNGVLAGVLAAVIVGMVGLSFASVPLYRLFCQATGYGGTPKIGPETSATISSKTIVVRFNADVNPALPWQFGPNQTQVTLDLGEQRIASYWAKNESDTPVTGVAVYNVAPESIGKYFHKTACFCFSSQTLEPNQRVDLPVAFWVDPAIATDPETADVHTITLSYTFFRSLDDAARTGALAKAGPHVGPLVR